MKEWLPEAKNYKKAMEAACTITTIGDLRKSRDVQTVRYGDPDPSSVPLLHDEVVVVVMPGWQADDGNAEVDFPYAESGEDAAQEYVDGGDWGDIIETSWINVWAWRRAYAIYTHDDGCQEIIEVAIDRHSHKIALQPEEPDCANGGTHDWRSPYDVVGGMEENPGVWGHGGGVLIEEVCRHCGTYRITDTWAQDMSDGTQGLESVEYREPDEASLAWIGEESV